MPDVLIDEMGPPQPFPSNSKKSKEEAVDQSRVKKVISGNILKKQKNFLDKVAETFFGDDAKEVGRYVIWDVLIPAAKNTLSEMVSTGIEMILFGESRGPSRKRYKDRNVIPYSTISQSRSRETPIDRESFRDRDRSRTKYRFDDLVIETKDEAYEVLDQMVTLTEDYGDASVGDLYDCLGLTSDFPDRKWGWTSLNRATVSRVRDGYILNLPPAVPLV